MNNKKKKNKPVTNGMQIPRIFIIIGHTLQFISYSWATTYAIKLFRTPIRFKTPESEKLMANNSKKTIHYIPEIDKKVVAYSYGESERKVLLVHGWSGRGTQLYKIADKLLENGYMTISFDAPAHGKSPGKITMMTEFVATIKQLEKEFGNFEIAIGHSLGGMAVLNAVKQGVNVQKIISIGAADMITDIIKNFVQKLKLKPIIVTKMKDFFFKTFQVDIDDYSASVAAKKVEIPAFIIHDIEDFEVAVSCAYNIRQNLKKGELLITNGFGHTRILKENLVIERIIKFIKGIPKE